MSDAKMFAQNAALFLGVSMKEFRRLATEDPWFPEPEKASPRMRVYLREDLEVYRRDFLDGKKPAGAASGGSG